MIPCLHDYFDGLRQSHGIGHVFAVQRQQHVHLVIGNGMLSIDVFRCAAISGLPFAPSASTCWDTNRRHYRLSASFSLQPSARLSLEASNTKCHPTKSARIIPRSAKARQIGRRGDQKNCFRRLLDRMHLSTKDTRLFLCARFAPSLRLRLEKRSHA